LAVKRHLKEFMATIRATPRLGEVARARVGHGVVIWDEKEVLLFGGNLV
jgi:hypothetical protein